MNRSPFLSINLRDILHGLLITVGGPMLAYAYQTLQSIMAGGSMPTMTDIQGIVQTCTYAGFMYLFKQFFSNGTGNFGKDPVQAALAMVEKAEAIAKVVSPVIQTAPVQEAPLQMVPANSIPQAAQPVPGVVEAKHL